jgi:hypothetical protein
MEVTKIKVRKDKGSWFYPECPISRWVVRVKKTYNKNIQTLSLENLLWAQDEGMEIEYIGEESLILENIGAKKVSED